MAITRRSVEFLEVAQRIDVILFELGLEVTHDVVDTELNARIEHVARLMRIQPRSAMAYLPEDLAELVAGTLAAAPRIPPSRGPSWS